MDARLETLWDVGGPLWVARVKRVAVVDARDAETLAAPPAPPPPRPRPAPPSLPEPVRKPAAEKQVRCARCFHRRPHVVAQFWNEVEGKRICRSCFRDWLREIKESAA